MNILCNIFRIHKWDKWELMRTDRYDLIQKRQCTKCGLIKTKYYCIIWD